MKKALLSLALLTGLSANAQLASGSIAPNWTFTDLDGTSHTLYDYLDDGYTVFIDVSAAWCGPCWNYHSSHALETLYSEHGPTGYPDVDAGTTDDAMVFFLEGEFQNTGAQITGTSGSGALFSQGDWTAGTSYPIIDVPNNTAGQAFMGGYAIAYFPTIYKVCPNRIITEVGQQTATNLYAGVGSCPPPASNPADAAMLMYNAGTEICPGAAYTPSVTIQNNGTSNMTDATVTVTLNGNPVSTGTFSGNLATYGVATVTCSAIANPTAGTLVATVTTANDAAAGNGSITKTLAIAPTATSANATVKVTTDRYGDEFTWTIKKSNGVTVASGGPYSQAGANGAYPQADVNFTLIADECYTINLMDEYGDGFDSGYGDGSFKVQINGSDLVVAPAWATDALEKKMYADAGLGVEGVVIEGFNVYPNPASGVVNVDFNATGGDYTVAIIDVTGRELATQTLTAAKGTQTVILPVDQLAAGNYIISVRTEGGVTTSHVVVK